jgi:predicted membrane protein
MKIKQNIKKSIVGIIVLFCLLLIYYFHIIVKTEIVFTHLFYIPIVISALWWKRTAIFIAVLLGIALIISHFFMGQGFVLADILRALMFIFIASMVNYLTEKNKEYLSKIKESETKFKTIAEYNYDWEFWLTNVNVFKYNSPSCERITGYKPIDFSNNPNLITQIIHPEDLSIYEKHLDFSSKKKHVAKLILELLLV